MKSFIVSPLGAFGIEFAVAQGYSCLFTRSVIPYTLHLMGASFIGQHFPCDELGWISFHGCVSSNRKCLHTVARNKNRITASFK